MAIGDDDEDIFLPRLGQVNDSIASAVNRPEVMSALLQFGLSALGGPKYYESGGAHLARSFGEAGEAAGRSQALTRSQQLEDERSRREDERLAGSEEERQHRQEERLFQRGLSTRREQRLEQQGATGRLWSSQAPAGTIILQYGKQFQKQPDGTWKELAKPAGE